MNWISDRASRFNFAANWLILNLVLLAVVLVLGLTYPVEELSRRVADSYFKLRGESRQSTNVALVLVDDASLERYGRWPWPRAQLARLVHDVSSRHPSAIGIDILLAEPGDPEGDNELARAIRDAGNVVLASKVSNSPDRTWTDPLPLFAAPAAGIGHVQAIMDPDGIERRIPLVELNAAGPRYPLAVETARVATDETIEEDDQVLRLGDRRIWLEGKPSRAQRGWRSFTARFLTVDFHRQLVPNDPGPAFLAIPAGAILDGSAVPPLRGKAVLIGFGASDLGDRIPTPVGGPIPMPGVEVHANLLEAVLAGHGLRHLNGGTQFLALTVFSLISTAVILRWPGWKTAWVPMALMIGAYCTGWLLFVRAGILLDLGTTVCVAVLAVPISQLQSLALVNRSLNRGLQQLRQALWTAKTSADTGTLTSSPDARDTASDLSSKLTLIAKMQAELASLYSFRQSLLESIQEGLAVFDSQGLMEFQNPCWERFCLRQGFRPDIDLVELGRILGHPGWSNMEERLRERVLPPECEVSIGGGFWQVRALALEQGPGASSRWMVVVIDLTSRLERDQARAEALRFVTHELRTPLVSIQGFAEFLLRYPKTSGSGEAAETIFRESQRLVSLINTYLDVLRFDAGARKLRRESIDMPAVVEQVVRVIAPIAEAAEIRIAVDLAPILPDLRGDTALLSGVLLNLLNNAVKYSAEGSEVSLHVAQEEDGAVVFEVRNPGPPIAPEHLSRFFEPFYRAQEHEGSAPGWGLGLTFVKRIVEEHRGVIEATSDESGIRVRVRLPVLSKEDDKNGSGDGSE